MMPHQQQLNSKLLHEKIKYHSKQSQNTYKRDIHQLRDHIFKETPVVKTKVIVGSRNNPNATQTLVLCRPAKKLSDTSVSNVETH